TSLLVLFLYFRRDLPPVYALEQLKPPASLELARQLGVGETTLRRIFRNEFGRSMLQYVRDRRLEIGRQMVREGRWQIAQIAYRLGYSSPENFTHAYRARFGHPPGRE
ncbi:helix-turn-helix transcriptional regulator, partial [Pseudomonas aeruginosa]|uniref:helix-turn-helix transcriptional regulator n=2 Tax=Pseudomonas aeruginosa TaxID=287 RepID=UPI0022373112